MSTLYSIGQMNQLADALESAGFTPDDVTKLRSFKNLPQFRAVLKGCSQIVLVKHIIDCDAGPFLFGNWKVEEHKKQGQLEWNPEKVLLYMSDSQKDGKCIKGDKLRKELESQPVLNANVLDYLLDHPELIPEEWKDKYVFFWGTIYRDSADYLTVRYLCWLGARWDWRCRLLVLNWLNDGHAALSAST